MYGRDSKEIDTRGLVAIASVVAIGMIVVIIIMYSNVGNKNVWRKALAESMYEVLIREEYIDGDVVTKSKFKSQIVYPVIGDNHPIRNDDDIEEQADVVIKNLVGKELHLQPIAKEYIMNIIKIEYHVANKNTKAGRTLK